MEKKTKAPKGLEQVKEVTLILSLTEARQVLAVLKHAEGVVNLLNTNGKQSVATKQNFLGKLIKKVGGVVTKASK